MCIREGVCERGWERKFRGIIRQWGRGGAGGGEDVCGLIEGGEETL